MPRMLTSNVGSRWPSGAAVADAPSGQWTAGWNSSSRLSSRLSCRILSSGAQVKVLLFFLKKMLFLGPRRRLRQPGSLVLLLLTMLRCASLTTTATSSTSSSTITSSSSSSSSSSSTTASGAYEQLFFIVDRQSTWLARALLPSLPASSSLPLFPLSFILLFFIFIFPCPFLSVTNSLPPSPSLSLRFDV